MATNNKQTIFLPLENVESEHCALIVDKGLSQDSTVIKKLIGLQPKTIIVIQTDGSEKQTAIEEVTVGNVILVKPGEKNSVDGMVTSDNSYVDESMLSGEPVLKKQLHTINASKNYKHSVISSTILLLIIIKERSCF